MSGDILLSGGWCLNPAFEKLIDERSLEVEVLPYHWDDREKYYKDFLDLTSIYERYLRELAALLNNYHAENFDISYWRLLAGPALYTILCHLLDRWNIAKNVLQKGFDTCPRIVYAKARFTPRMTLDLNPDCHDYNHYLLSSALSSLGVVFNNGKHPASHESPKTTTENAQAVVKRSSLKRRLKFALERMAYELGLSRMGKTFVVSSYLPRAYDFVLRVICMSTPAKFQAHFETSGPVDVALRDNMSFSASGEDAFSQFASRLLPMLIPTYLLEDYRHLSSCWKVAEWPEAPRSVFTSNAFQFNEVFQHYMATQRAKHGSRLIVGQHGGVSGILKWSFGTEHQISISDRFFSWGWSSTDPKIVPGVVLTNFGKRIRASKRGCMLLTTVPMRKYSHKGGAWPVGPVQSQEFLADQLNFYRHLGSAICPDVVLRIFGAQDIRFESGYVREWTARYPDIRIDNSKLPIDDALRKTRLFVYTYNSTGYLESLAMNFPTVMFWNPQRFETNDQFTLALEGLERVGVFHSTPESAAEHVNRIWNNIDDWWTSSAVQAAVDLFTSHFARPPKIRNLFDLGRLIAEKN